jgi:hypothetical protein
MTTRKAGGKRPIRRREPEYAKSAPALNGPSPAEFLLHAGLLAEQLLGRPALDSALGGQPEKET